VLGSPRTSADVRLLRVDYIDTFKPEEGADAHKSYDVRYRGIHSQWSVVRVADGAIISDGHGSRQAATTVLNEHLKAMK